MGLLQVVLAKGSLCQWLAEKRRRKVASRQSHNPSARLALAIERADIWNSLFILPIGSAFLSPQSEAGVIQSETFWTQ